MRLLVDIGNCRVKWALAGAGGVDALRCCAHADCAAAWHGLAPSRILVSSVLDDERTQAVLAPLAGCDILRITARAAAAGVINAYADSASLGTDRWLNLLAARIGQPDRDAVVADAGSALTVDGLRADGRHVGGAIAPGYRALARGMAATAPSLPAAAAAGDLPARSTAAAVAGGLRTGLAGALERLAAEVGRDLEAPVRILTGGDADYVRPLLAADWRVDPLLTLRGLLVAEKSECAGSR